MSYVELEAHDTLRTPILFSDGEDRRRGARVPLGTPVQVGPPGGVPHAAVWAADLSVGGLFIRADREVRIGARFSVAIPDSGDDASLYVAEAEVIYNRHTPHDAGFGVRFIALKESVLLGLERLVARGTVDVKLSTPPSNAQSEVSSDTPTMLPSVHPLDGVRLSAQEDQFFDEVESTPGSDRCGVQRIYPTSRPRDRNYWLIGAAAGLAVVCVGLAATLFGGGANEAVASETAWQDGRVRTVTHQVLMGERDPAALDEVQPPEVVSPKASSSSPAPAPKTPLPELVTVDGLLAVQGPPAPAEPWQAEPAKPAKPKARKKRAAPAKRRDSRRAPWKKAAGSHGRTVTLDLPVDQGARVKRTVVYDKPHRFVIDVLGQTTAPKLPAGSGAVRKVRFGRHEDFCRYVLDVDRPIEVGRVTQYGTRLQVVLRHH